MIIIRHRSRNRQEDRLYASLYDRTLQSLAFHLHLGQPPPAFPLISRRGSFLPPQQLFSSNF